jgi:hypothetical protein
MATDKNWNKMETVLKDEYSSTVESMNENVLRPLVSKKTSLDRDALDATLNDLSDKLRSEEIKAVPQKIKNAYVNLKNLATVLKNSEDKEITQNLDVMEKLFSLYASCSTYGDELGIDGIYFGRNPCREEQHGLYSALAKAKRRISGSSKLLDAIDGTLRTCSDCPHK